MESIRWPSYSGSGGTKYTKFIQCVYGQEPQIHELCFLGLDNSTREFHPTAQVDIAAGTVLLFTTNYLAENGYRILFIGQLSISRSVQLLGIIDFVRGSALLFIENLQGPTDTTGWGHGDTSNHKWGVSPRGSYINAAVAWVTTSPDRLDYMHRSPVDSRAAARRVCDDFLCPRCRERKRSSTTSCSPVVNHRIHCHGDSPEGPVTQYFLLQNSVASVRNLSFLSITSVIKCLQIACRIDFCLIRIR